MSFSGSGSFSGSFSGSEDEGGRSPVFHPVQQYGQGSNITLEQLRKEMLQILFMHPQPGLVVGPMTPAPRLLKILQDILASNEQKIKVLEYLHKELQRMVSNHQLPQKEVIPGMPPQLLLKILDDILQFCRWKFAAMFPPSKYGEFRRDMQNFIESRKEAIQQTMNEYLSLEKKCNDLIKKNILLGRRLEIESKEHKDLEAVVESYEKDIEYLEGVGGMIDRSVNDLEKDLNQLDWKLLSLTSKKPELSSIYFDAKSQLESSHMYPLRKPAASTPKTHGFGSGAHRISPLPRRKADTSAKKIEQFMSRLKSVEESDDLGSPIKFRLGSWNDTF